MIHQEDVAGPILDPSFYASRLGVDCGLEKTAMLDLASKITYPNLKVSVLGLGGKMKRLVIIKKQRRRLLNYSDQITHLIHRSPSGFFEE